MGLSGVLTLVVAMLIEFTSLAYRSSGSTRDGKAFSSGSFCEPSNVRDEGHLSMSNIEDNMVIANFFKNCKI